MNLEGIHYLLASACLAAFAMAGSAQAVHVGLAENATPIHVRLVPLYAQCGVPGNVPDTAHPAPLPPADMQSGDAAVDSDAQRPCPSSPSRLGTATRR